MAHGLTLAPLYDTLGEDTVKYVLNQTGTRTLALVDSHIELLCKLKENNELKALRNLIYMDDISLEHAQMVKKAGFVAYAMDALISYGAGNSVPISTRPINKKTIWTLCYTSGTTGDPKGVMITQANFTSMMAAIGLSSFNFTPKKETILSYLPLAHVAERCIYFSTFFYGGKIACFYGDKKKLTAVCGIVKPTIFLSVPRLYNKIFNVFQ
jgi:long-chain acyl-CoA synthetase